MSEVQALAGSPGSAVAIYAGTDAGVFRSTDAGVTWAPAGHGLQNVSALAIDPLTASTIYATAGTVVYKSWDGGDNWTPALSSMVRTYDSLAIHPTNPLTLLAGAPEGASRSIDGGANWHDIPVTATALAIDPVHPNIVYAARPGGTVDRSTDHGTSWTTIGAGLDDAVGALAVSPSTPGTVFAGSLNWAGVMKTTDAGGAWAPANQGILFLTVGSVELHPAAPQTLLASTGGAGLFRSTDGGGSWAPGHKGLTPRQPDAVAFAPASPATAYATTSSGTFRSTDSGGSWNQMGAPPPSITWVLEVDPDNVNTLFAGTSDGVFTSTDAGGTWQVSALTAELVTALAFDPSNTATRYAGTGSGPFKSTDSGATWAPANAGIADRWVSSLAVDPSDSSTVYAGVGMVGSVSGGVFKSTDGGATWREANRGLPADRWGSVRLLADPWRPGTLYSTVVTSSARGTVFRSTDSGEHWQSIGSSAAPDGPGTDDMALDSAGNALYVAGHGVWRADSPVATFVKGDLDGDGRADLVFANTADARQHKVWLMNGVERAAEAVVTPDTPGADWQVRGVDCFDTDGRSDLLLWNRATGQVEFWLLNGTTRVGTPKPLGGAPVLPTNWEPVATADFDRLFSPDILWRNTTSGKLVVWTTWETQRLHTLIPTPNQAADRNWDVVAAQDYDDDGNVDLLWYNATSGKVVIWLLDATLTRTSGQFTTPASAGDANWRPVASADYSRTGLPGTPPLRSPDIVWRNETSGNQVVWHMDFGSARVHGEFTSPAANTPALDWTIVGPR